MNMTDADKQLLNAPRRAGIAMLEALPKHSVGAEIGVFHGGFSRLILDIVHPVALTLIDPWQWHKQWYVNHSVQEIELINSGGNTPEGEALYKGVVERFNKSPEVKVLRATSVEASQKFPDNHFDWVFIDGDHRYAPVRDDIHHWWPKLKRSRFLCGDDYRTD